MRRAIRCRTCRFWDPRYPENPELGLCQKAGVIVFEREAALTMREATDLNDPTSDFAAVRTRDVFGCVEHTARNTYLRTLDSP